MKNQVSNFNQISKSISVFALFILMMTTNVQLNAQDQSVLPEFKPTFEVKINPVFALFNLYQIEGEYIIRKDVGIGGELIVGEGLTAVFAHGKYYFNQNLGGDKFYAGAFVGGYFTDESGEGVDTGLGLGFDVGYKFVSSNNKVLLEIATGLGRTVNDGVLPYGKLALGYRFSK